jgi:hypothetical protein
VSPGRRKTVDLTWEAAKETLQAKAEIERMGIEFAPRPDGESPALPRDPTELDDSQLMVAFTNFMGWVDFSATQLGFAEVDERCAESMLDKKRDLLMLRKRPTAEALRKGEERITLIKAEIEDDPDVIELAQAHAIAYARRKLLNTTYERYDRDAFVLSREITRRGGGQDPKLRRQSRWTT